jgi:signal transduction histidine kinase/pSer/pThr/pTyr-binding forkhead associated (FHA) protein
MANEQGERHTNRLTGKVLKELGLYPQVDYQALPADFLPEKRDERLRWRVRFALVSNPSISFGYDLYGDVVLGRGNGDPALIDLEKYNAIEYGVSRRHARLNLTPSRLFIIDLNSTNGTRRNGHSIGVNTPYQLMDGDLLALGALQLSVHVVHRPETDTGLLHQKADLADVVAQTTRAITSQLELSAVLEQVVEGAMSLTSADETLVWLVDEQTNEIQLKAYRGADEERISQLRLTTDSLVGKVIQSGQAMRESQQLSDRIKIQTGYLAEALLLLPITLGNVTFGVLGAVQVKTKRYFSQRDEHLLMTIAELAAITVQNARLFQATDRELSRRVQQLAALNELSQTVTSSLDLEVVHDVLVEQIKRYWTLEGVVLWLVNTEDNAVSPYIRDGDASPNGEWRTSQQVHEVIDRVVRSGAPLSIDIADLAPAKAVKEEAEPGEDEPGPVPSGGGEPPFTVVCLPLLVKNEVVGVLALLRKRGQGKFDSDDMLRLQAFAHPVATAIQNANLYFEARHERAIVDATANTLPQPLLILDQRGKLILANEAANRLLEKRMSAVFQGITNSVGKTIEVSIEEGTYLATTEHSEEVGTITVMQDITYMKQLEDARLEFVHALSHDLKSPLTSIRAYAELLNVTEKLSETGQTYVEGINSAVLNATTLIDQLLDIALLTEAPTSNHRPCDLIDVLSKAMNAVEGAALAKSIKIRLMVNGKRYRIRGDATRLARSFQNMLDNAIKYAPEGSQVQVTLDYTEDDVRISVLDDGPGVPAEDIPHLFERFYRGKQRMKGALGHGLGLVLVDATARAHGGDALVENVEGHGARFAICLPSSLRVK